MPLTMHRYSVGAEPKKKYVSPWVQLVMVELQTVFSATKIRPSTGSSTKMVHVPWSKSMRIQVVEKTPTKEKRLVKGEPGIPFFSVFKGNPKLDGSGNLFHLFM